MNKRLEEMNKEELGKLFPIIISPYNPLWPYLYLKEKIIIEKAIGMSKITRIRHFGSTSIPGLEAKPTIDILLEVVEDIDQQQLIKEFLNIGYKYTQQLDNPPPHMMFMKGYTIHGFEGQTYHVHVRFWGDWDEIYFRDYLNLYSEVAKEYVKLKKKLQEKHKHNREAYTQGKTEFIKRITQKARKELKS